MLSGLKVVSLALNVPGPLAATALQNDGAQIIKIEPPKGDPLAHYSPEWYQDLHQQIEIQRINLKTHQGQRSLADLLIKADLLITSSRPSALARLNLSADRLSKHYPELCWVGIVGDTQAPEIPGHDLTYQAKAGLLDSKNPTMPRTLIADMMGSRDAYAAALALLLGRERGSSERHRLVGLNNAARYAALPRQFGLTATGGLLSGTEQTYTLYQTANGWIAAAPLEPHFAHRWHNLVGDSPAQTIRQKTTAHWVELGKTLDLPLVGL